MQGLLLLLQTFNFPLTTFWKIFLKFLVVHLDDQILKSGCPDRNLVVIDDRTSVIFSSGLTLTNRKIHNEQPAAHEFQKCEKHGKELNMFCSEAECNEPICRTCLRKEHKNHDFTDIEEREKENLTNEVVKLKKHLETKLKMMSDAKKNIDEKTKAVLEEIKKKKEQVVSLFDKMINETEEQNKLQNVRIDDEISAMNSNLDLLISIQQKTESEEDTSYEEIMNGRDTVMGISEHNKANLSGKRSFGYPIFIADKCPAEENIGKVVREEVTVSLPEPENFNPAKNNEPPPRNIKHASQLKCSGIYIPHFTLPVNKGGIRS